MLSLSQLNLKYSFSKYIIYMGNVFCVFILKGYLRNWVATNAASNVTSIAL